MSRMRSMINKPAAPPPKLSLGAQREILSRSLWIKNPTAKDRFTHDIEKDLFHLVEFTTTARPIQQQCIAVFRSAEALNKAKEAANKISGVDVAELPPAVKRAFFTKAAHFFAANFTKPAAINSRPPLPSVSSGRSSQPKATSAPSPGSNLNAPASASSNPHIPPNPASSESPRESTTQATDLPRSMGVPSRPTNNSPARPSTNGVAQSSASSQAIPEPHPSPEQATDGSSDAPVICSACHDTDLATLHLKLFKIQFGSGIRDRRLDDLEKRNMALEEQARRKEDFYLDVLYESESLQSEIEHLREKNEELQKGYKGLAEENEELRDRLALIERAHRKHETGMQQLDEASLDFAAAGLGVPRDD